MKLIQILVTFLTLITTPALAQDSFLLFSKGHWNVLYTDPSWGPPTCVAEVSDNRELYFSIDVTQDSLTAWYITSYNDFGLEGISGTVLLQIDTKGVWNTPAYGKGTGIQMYGLREEFLLQLQDGQQLSIDQNADGQWDAWFSLDGSAAALYALVDCKNKL